MTSPAHLRDSTQIVLPHESLAGHRSDLEKEFTLSLQDRGEAIRLIGSPVVIKEVSEWLSRRGVFVP